jgi:tetratricopeptide (TPR) repeat protein
LRVPARQNVAMAIVAAPPKSSVHSERLTRYHVGGALLLLTILSYLPVLHDKFIWDDDFYVEHNATLRSVSGLWNLWTDIHATPQYYPLVHTSYWIEYHLWGVRPVGYHADNVLLHATSVLLLWRLLRRLDLPGAALVAALFAVHPVAVESVAWVTERKNVLSGVFYLLAFGKYLTAIDAPRTLALSPGTPGAGEAPSTITNLRAYFSAIALFMLALFSKTVTATLPAALLLTIWWKRGRLRWRDVVPLLPMFVLGAAMGTLTGFLERTQVGAHGPDFAWLTPTDRILIAGRAICFYAGKLLLPINLSFIYPRWRIDPHAAGQYAFPLGVLAVVAALWMLRRRIGRGPLTAILFFIGTLFPALGLANVYPMRYSFVADHFQYLAMIGPLALVGPAIWRLPRSAATAVSALLLAMLSCLTFARCFAYHDRLTLWLDTQRKNPNAWMVHTNLGHAYHAAGQDQAAEAQYQRSLELAPDEPEPHLNAAITDGIHHRYAAAAQECRLAIAIDPSYAPAYANLCKALASAGDTAGAVAAGTQAVGVAPRYADAHAELAAALQQQGDLRAAAAQYAAALQLNPDDADAHFHLADCLAGTGHVRAAIAEYEASLALQPNNAPAWTTLGYSLAAVGQPADAAGCFRRALQIDPRLAPARVGLQRFQSR